MGWQPTEWRRLIVNPKKLETGLRTNSALLGIEAIGFPTFGLLL